MKNTSGRRWARTFLALALFVSVVGNVAHTVLADSSISLWLRIPGAVIWPLFTFGGIEIVVRMIWERSFTHRLGRNMVLLPAVPAAITSYQHLYSLLGMMGEERFIALIGPFAIDGMMIGCTMVLLFTRPQLHPQAVDLDEVLRRHGVTGDWDRAAETELDNRLVLNPGDRMVLDDAPVSPAPVSVPPATPRAVRAWDAARVAQMVVDGEKDPIIQQVTGASKATIGRFRTVAYRLRDNPRADVDLVKAKLRPEHVTMIRDLVSR